MVNVRDALTETLLPEAGSAPVEWAIADGLVGYEEAVAEMEARVAAIIAGEARERVWLVEHPPLSAPRVRLAHATHCGSGAGHIRGL